MPNPNEDFITVTKFNREIQSVYNEVDEIRDEIKELKKIVESMNSGEGISEAINTRIKSLEEALSTVITELNELKKEPQKTIRGF